MVIRYSEIWIPAFGQSDAGMNMLFAGQDMSRGGASASGLYCQGDELHPCLPLPQILRILICHRQ